MMDPSSSSPELGFSENADFCESTVTYNARQPDAVTIRMKETGTYMNHPFSHTRTEIVPRGDGEMMESDVIRVDMNAPLIQDPEVGSSTGSTDGGTGRQQTKAYWLTFRSWAVAAARSWWDAAQTSLKMAVDRIQTWPNEDAPGGPRWVVRIVSEYDNPRGEITKDIVEWEFSHPDNAERFVLYWNTQIQKKRLFYPYNVYIFKKEENQLTPMEEEIRRAEVPEGSFVHETVHGRSAEHLLYPGGIRFEEFY